MGEGKTERAGATMRGLFPELDTEPAVRPRGTFAQVALNRPVRTEFTYAVPAELEGAVRRGMRARVPFGRRREVGLVVGTSDSSELAGGRIRPLERLLDEHPIVDDDLLELARWMGRTYACSWGEALHAVLPAALKRDRARKSVLVAEVVPGVGPDELAALEGRASQQHRLLRTLLELGEPVELRDLVRRLGLSDGRPARRLEQRGWVRLRRVAAAPDELLLSRGDRPRPERLTPEQEVAVAAIVAELEAGRHRAFLLEGVTGSGKTEVYLRAIEEALARGRSAIVLVPEISLTPQTVGWFRSRFEEVAVLHSGMSDAQRLDMWSRVRSARARVVVGARSAVFAPVRELGVIVVDEEHEPSFKQATAPRYHAREVAVERARRAGAVCVLGSATPSLESWSRLQERPEGGEPHRHLVLSTRISGRPLPPIDVIDMRAERGEIEGSELFSRRLRHLMEQALAAGEQVILFLNRRGFTPVLWCRHCKLTVRCGRCDVSLTFHRHIGRAVCHSCCEEIRPPSACPACGAPGLRYLGAGSERIERELARLLPGARVRRMDSDTMRRSQDYQEALGAFGRGEIDVLVGTQMIAKGLDFPGVTVVGIINADCSLRLPDFRASERTFQLIAQVAGRAGRGPSEGHIVVQTFAPTEPPIVLAARHDYRGFAARESAHRADAFYPPHARLVRALFEDSDPGRVERAALQCVERLKVRLAGHRAAILPAAPAPISRLRNRSRWHVLVKVPLAGDALEAVREELIALSGEMTRPRMAIDVDPVNLM